MVRAIAQVDVDGGLSVCGFYSSGVDAAPGRQSVVIKKFTQQVVIVPPQGSSLSGALHSMSSSGFLLWSCPLTTSVSTGVSVSRGLATRLMAVALDRCADEAADGDLADAGRAGHRVSLGQSR